MEYVIFGRTKKLYPRAIGVGYHQSFLANKREYFMVTPSKVLIGSRTSSLSIVQAEEVQNLLVKQFPELDFRIVTLSTLGDRNKTAPLLSMERGMFVKEIEEALISRKIDIAVHSAKDVPANIPPGLEIIAFTPRWDHRDVLVSKTRSTFKDLPKGARLGTSSPRRIAQLKAIRSDLEFVPIRGNIETRIQKSSGTDYDAVVLAAAGIARLDRTNEISDYFSPEICVPDVGQGALALETRENDVAIKNILQKINSNKTSIEVKAERSFLTEMGGGCTVPVAAFALLDNEYLTIRSMVSSADNRDILHLTRTYLADDPELAGKSLARELLDLGGEEMIKIR